MWGKVFGALVGVGVGLLIEWNPVLAGAMALAGILLGHFALDRDSAGRRADALLGPPKRRLNRTARPNVRRITVDQLQLADVLCPLFIEVARCDGPVVQPEIRVIREYFELTLHFDETGLEAVRAGLKAALAGKPQDVEELTKKARGEVKPAQRMELVRTLYDLGTVDAELTRSEIDTLKRVVGQLNLSDEQLQEITKQFFGSGDAHYRLLGLEPSATDDEVKSAFRKLAAENHPDRVASLGPKEAEVAGERFRQVKDAYDALKKLRGF
jgi:DnaJ like chaperone protein